MFSGSKYHHLCMINELFDIYQATDEIHEEHVVSCLGSPDSQEIPDIYWATDEIHEEHVVSCSGSPDS
jgi:hypothetical protein